MKVLYPIEIKWLTNKRRCRVKAQGRLLRPMTVGDQPCNQMHHKAGDTAVPGMFNLADVLQLIIDGLDQDALPQEQFVPETQQPILHVLADFGEECQSWVAQDVMQGLGDIASVTKKLSTKAGSEALDRLAVIDIAWRHAKS